MADHINSLSNDLLCRILSFLSTKQAMQTSILCRRWRYLWLSVPTLDFSETNISTQDEASRFVEFVYSALLSRHSTSTIHTFHFDVDFGLNKEIKFPVASFHKWVKFILEHGVRSFDLSVVSASLPKLPNAIFSSETLVVLHLFFFRVHHHLSSSSCNLPCLKSLRLKFIRFPRDRDLMVLLQACKNLSDFQISCIRCSNSDEVLYNAWKNIGLTNLNRATVDATYLQLSHFSLLAVRHVQKLCLSMAKVNLFNNSIPTFTNLTYLRISSFNYRWSVLVEILEHCPNLHGLAIDEAGGSDAAENSWTRKDDKETWVDPDFVPRCLQFHLITCYLGSFLGLQGEILMAAYILKNATVLKTMKIWNSGNPEIERLLSSFPKASSTCKLTIHQV